MPWICDRCHKDITWALGEPCPDCYSRGMIDKEYDTNYRKGFLAGTEDKKVGVSSGAAIKSEAPGYTQGYVDAQALMDTLTGVLKSGRGY